MTGNESSSAQATRDITGFSNRTLPASRARLYARLTRVARQLTMTVGLMRLHFKSRALKLKLRMLERRYLSLRKECQRLAVRIQTPAHRPATRAAESTMSSKRHGPIWLHGSWRTGSTYVWNKLRADNRYRAYYEPFHERLEYLTLEDIQTAMHDTWHSHHPDISAPYFHEYRDLVRDIGVAHFMPSLPYRNFFLNDDDAPEQRQYLGALIEHAERTGQRAVFGFCRSWGRVRWFQTYAQPGVHITLTRDPLGMWRSAFDRYEKYGDTYFLTMPFVALSLAFREPWLSRYIEQLKLDVEPQVDLGKMRRRTERLLKSDPALIMRVFAATHGLGHTMAVRYGDLTVAIEDLACPMRRRGINDTLLGRYDIDLDWTDCRVPIYERRSEDEPFLAAWTQARTVAETILDGHKWNSERPDWLAA